MILRGKGSHKPELEYNIVRLDFLRTFTDLVEYIIVGDTKAPLLQCFLFDFNAHVLETLYLLDST